MPLEDHFISIEEISRQGSDAAALLRFFRPTKAFPGTRGAVAARREVAAASSASPRCVGGRERPDVVGIGHSRARRGEIGVASGGEARPGVEALTRTAGQERFSCPSQPRSGAADQYETNCRCTDFFPREPRDSRRASPTPRSRRTRPARRPPP